MEPCLVRLTLLVLQPLLGRPQRLDTLFSTLGFAQQASQRLAGFGEMRRSLCCFCPGLCLGCGGGDRGGFSIAGMRGHAGCAGYGIASRGFDIA